MDKTLQRTVAKLKHLSVCNVLDAMGPSWPVESVVHPVDPSFRVCGPAFTVECVPGDNLTLHHALYLAEPGDVLVVGGSPECSAGLWGELMSTSARAKGLAGTIIDGPVRDPEEIRALAYPVFCRQFHPRRAAKERYGRINISIDIGAISVQPNYIVLGDANGIVCIPADRLSEVLQFTLDVASKEADIKRQIRSGHTLFEILNLQRFVTARDNQPA